mmetsp:Transcript_15980/g.19510  ORF Transcript_15980/g.19510 Transcript_15980/m.19510 type:complete len:398 (-) Transcript_15980:106-1299(-)
MNLIKKHPRSNSRRLSCIICFILFLTIQTCFCDASGIKSSILNWINGEDGSTTTSSTSSIKTLSMVEIYDMRARDIKRRLARQHGYGADELVKMIDKKDLVNALAFEEHKDEQKEQERKKRIALRRGIITALVCVILVMFKGLLVHAFEVASINFVVYTDKKKYEWTRCRELGSIKALFGLFLTVFVNSLQLWLSVSVLLSWVMKSEYFFPVPHIPIRPAALLASASGAGASGAGPLGQYGLNVGPMAISWLFRFVNGRIEQFMGKALLDAQKHVRKQQKAARKEEERKEEEILRKERKAARRARRAERELRKQQAAATSSNVDDDSHGKETPKAYNDNASSCGSGTDDKEKVMDSQQSSKEKQNHQEQQILPEKHEKTPQPTTNMDLNFTGMDELD